MPRSLSKKKKAKEIRRMERLKKKNMTIESLIAYFEEFKDYLKTIYDDLPSIKNVIETKSGLVPAMEEKLRRLNININDTMMSSVDLDLAYPLSPEDVKNILEVRTRKWNVQKDKTTRDIETIKKNVNAIKNAISDIEKKYQATMKIVDEKVRILKEETKGYPEIIKREEAIKIIMLIADIDQEEVAENLFFEYKSFASLIEASVDNLTAVHGIDKMKAKKIYTKFHPTEEIIQSYEKIKVLEKEIKNLGARK